MEKLKKAVLITRIINITLLLVTLLTFQTFMHYKSLVREAKDNATFVNRFYAQELINEIIKTEHILKTVSSVASAEKLDNKSFRQFLKEYIERDADFSAIGITDKDGNAILSTIETKEKINLKDRKYFQEVKENLRLSSGNFLIGRLSNQKTIAFGYPILDKEHNFNGIAFAGIKLEAINKMIEKLYLPQDASIMLFDETGTIITRFPDNEKWVEKNLANKNEVIKKAISEKKVGAVISYDLDQNEKVFAYRPIEYEGNNEKLFLASGFSTDVIKRPMINITLISFGFLVIFVLFSAVIDSLIINHIIKNKSS